MMTNDDKNSHIIKMYIYLLFITIHHNKIFIKKSESFLSSFCHHFSQTFLEIFKKVSVTFFSITKYFYDHYDKSVFFLPFF